LLVFREYHSWLICLIVTSKALYVVSIAGAYVEDPTDSIGVGLVVLARHLSIPLWGCFRSY
jgi:hypothetical protein